MAYDEMPPKHAIPGLKCGSCEWFTNGHNGKNCQITRGVKFDTDACREHSQPILNEYADIAKDKIILSIRKDLRADHFKISKTIKKELLEYIKNDQYQFYRFGTFQDMDAIVQYLKRITIIRSRVSNIYTSILDIDYDLKELIRKAKSRLYQAYDKIKGLRNENDRQVALDIILPETITIDANIHRVKEIAKDLDKRLDNHDRTLSRILSASEKIFNPKERNL